MQRGCRFSALRCCPDLGEGVRCCYEARATACTAYLTHYSDKENQIVLQEPVILHSAKQIEAQCCSRSERDTDACRDIRLVYRVIVAYIFSNVIAGLACALASADRLATSSDTRLPARPGCVPSTGTRSTTELACSSKHAIKKQTHHSVGRHHM